jgi:hypothetical protein
MGFYSERGSDWMGSIDAIESLNHRLIQLEEEKGNSLILLL